MRSRLEERLNTLRGEYENGQKMLSELESKRAQLTQTLLRIEGAMQVIQELLQQEARPADDGSPAPESAR